MDTPLQPGTFVRLKNQPADLPDFVVEQCLGAFCWIRQQAWGDLVQWKVKTVMVEPVSKRVILQRLSSAMAQQG